MKLRIKKAHRKRLPKRVQRAIYDVLGEPSDVPPPGTVRLGDMERATPFSTDFGFDRGGPVDRYYIEGFLEARSADVRGRVLEIGDDNYTRRFGRSKVEKIDILHVDDTNPQATIVGDLNDLPQVPDDTFDCIIVTQTLQFLYDVEAAIRTCHRILRPGGVLLVTVPGITQLDYCKWREHWYWSFTENSMRRIFANAFRPGDVTIDTYGNAYMAATFLYGMGLPEVRKDLLDQKDPCFQAVISVHARKKA